MTYPPVRKGNEYLWAVPGKTGLVKVYVRRVARDGTWADIICTTPEGGKWSKRQVLPFPETFWKVTKLPAGHWVGTR